MLGLYIDTFIITLTIGHRFCSMLNELTLQRGLQHFMANDVFWTKIIIITQQQQNKKSKQ